MKHILMVCGDASADRHAAGLVRALKAKEPTLRVTALGGRELQKVADQFLFPLVAVGGFGFWEPLLKLPSFYKALGLIKWVLKKDRPDAVIPIDYYGFNIRTARLAHERGIPVIYYVSPQVWASREGRIKKLAAVVNKMLVIFPFEVDLYKEAKVPVSFVGHPLIERLPQPGSETPRPTVGLLPGSRRATIARHLPVLIQTADLLRKDHASTRWILFRPDEIEEDFYRPYLKDAPWLELTTDPGYEIRKGLWLAIGVSGTAALENMLLGIPMIIMYKLSGLTYWIAKQLVKVAYIGIPNILAGRLVVPELIQDQATPENLSQTAMPYLSDPAKRRSTRETLLSLRASLQEGGSSKAADEILATNCR